jgi:phosphoglycerol transferase MdoB-like AlkP superfamily enzyme
MQIKSLADNFRHAIWKISNKTGPFAPLFSMLLLGLVILSLTRLGLVVWQLNRVQVTGALFEVLYQGVRVDVIQLGLIALIPILLAPFMAIKRFFKLWKWLTYSWVLIAIVLLVFLEAATPGFIMEYDVRPNRIFVEYLKYPHEVMSMLWTGFKIHIFASLTFTVLAVLAMRYWMQPWKTAQSTWTNKRLWLIWPLVLIIAVLAIRSSLGHRPANPALFAITEDSLVNSLILNSGYSVMYAVLPSSTSLNILSIICMYSFEGCISFAF